MTREPTDPTNEDPSSVPRFTQYALALANDGFRVFPVPARSKEPKLHDWPNRATVEPREIEAWGTRQPGANIGIATGSGLVVIDVDGPEGAASFAGLQARLGELPETRTATTGKGFHLYFRVAGPVRNRVALATGLDVRGDGGYVVAPPSIHPTGREYTWSDPGPIAELPAAWGDALTARDDDGERYRTPQVIPLGSIDNELTRAAGYFRNGGMDAAEIADALEIINRRAPESTHNRHDLERLAAGAMKWAPGEWASTTITRVSTGIKDPDASLASSLRPSAVPVFQTAADFCAETPETVDWLWSPYIAAGDLVELDGKPKVGKTTLIWHLIKAITSGSDFLGGSTPGGPVVLLTEMSGSTLKEQLQATGLTDNRKLSMITYDKAAHLSWPAVAAMAVEECRRIDARLLVIDTVFRWLKIAGEDGNAAGTWTRGLEPVMGLKATGTAVLLLHWERKSGGSVGDSGLGSTSLAGTVDAILQLTKIDGGDSSHHRKLSATSRHADVPEDVVIDLAAEGYRLIGEGKAAIRRSVADRLLELLADGEPRTLNLLVTECAGSASKTTVRTALDGLIRREQVRMIEGKRGGKDGSVPSTYQLHHVVTRGAKTESKDNPHIHQVIFGDETDPSKITSDSHRDIFDPGRRDEAPF